MVPFGTGAGATPGAGDNNAVLLPSDCNTAELKVLFTGAPTSTYSYTLYLKPVGAAGSAPISTPLTCSVGSGASDCSDLRANVASAGDLLFMRMTGTQAFNAGTVSAYVLLSCKF
jgi:hypothetical protein